MRSTPSILHLDLDAFFAAVEQRDKPSLRGKPVVVGGIGPRGVVSTASYEARRYGVRSAMPTTQARARCPHAAYLAGRFPVYRAASAVVFAELRKLSDLMEPLSLDEAFVDLAVDHPDLDVDGARDIGRDLRERVRAGTGGLTASVGVGTSKLIAKMASEQAKPDGLLVVPPGGEFALLHPQPIRAMPGIGPATAARLSRYGITTIGDLAAIPLTELVDLLGSAHGQSLHHLAHARDDRHVVPERESKSISVEDTFDTDLTDPAQLESTVTVMARRVTQRMVASGLSARTVTLKARLHDFTTMSRSATLPGPTDHAATITSLALRLLREIDHADGVRLLGVGLSGFSDWVQDDLFGAGFAGDAGPAVARPGGMAPGESANADEPVPGPVSTAAAAPKPITEDALGRHRWLPGADVEHAGYGRGWVWGAGAGRVTVRFETAETPPGPVRTFAATDPDLKPVRPADSADSHLPGAD